MDRRAKFRLRQQVIIYKNIRTQDIESNVFDKILYLVIRKMICQNYKKKPSHKRAASAEKGREPERISFTKHPSLLHELGSAQLGNRT